jgi:hypothetical protein
MTATPPKTVKLSDGLLRAARTAAAHSGRSLIEQIEFWVVLGREVDHAVRPQTARKLLRMYPLPRRRTKGRAKAARSKNQPRK